MSARNPCRAEINLAVHRVREACVESCATGHLALISKLENRRLRILTAALRKIKRVSHRDSEERDIASRALKQADKAIPK